MWNMQTEANTDNMESLKIDNNKIQENTIKHLLGNSWINYSFFFGKTTIFIFTLDVYLPTIL